MLLLNNPFYYNYEVKIGHYPDGTLMLKLDDLEFTPTNIQWNYENDAELFALICLRKHWPNTEMTLTMPYCPHARMDRVHDDDDVFTLKYFCEIINSLNFSEVYVRDAHSNVCLALLNNVTLETPEDFILNAIEELDERKENLVLFFPDEGAMKRYSDMTELPYAFGIKKRDWKTGKIQGLDIVNKELVVGKSVLIIDDICSRGGTFYHAGNALKEAGAEHIYLYVTHAEHTMVQGDMYVQDIIEHIFTTDSIFKLDWDVRDKVSIVEDW